MTHVATMSTMSTKLDRADDMLSLVVAGARAISDDIVDDAGAVSTGIEFTVGEVKSLITEVIDEMKKETISPTIDLVA